MEASRGGRGREMVGRELEDGRVVSPALRLRLGDEPGEPRGGREEMRGEGMTIPERAAAGGIRIRPLVPLDARGREERGCEGGSEYEDEEMTTAGGRVGTWV